MKNIKPYTQHLKESEAHGGIPFVPLKSSSDPTIVQLTDDEREYAQTLIEGTGRFLDRGEIKGWKLWYEDFMNHYELTNSTGKDRDGSMRVRIIPFYEGDDYVFVDALFWNEEDEWGGNPTFLPYSVYNVMDYMTGDIEADVEFFEDLVIEMAKRSIQLMERTKDSEELESHVDSVPYTGGSAIARSERAKKKKRSRGAFGRF